MSDDFTTARATLMQLEPSALRAAGHASDLSERTYIAQLASARALAEMGETLKAIHKALITPKPFKG